MDATMGQLVYLPAGVAGPDPDAFLSDRADRLAAGAAGAELLARHGAAPSGVGAADRRLRRFLSVAVDGGRCR